ncbi:MAG: Dihydrolipoamide acyltransferase component of branched-chain alpha-keto acid dehydrogenase complex, partial [uncultured Gemmatimonadaceae bacterium]
AGRPVGARGVARARRRQWGGARRPARARRRVAPRRRGRADEPDPPAHGGAHDALAPLERARHELLRDRPHARRAHPRQAARGVRARDGREAHVPAVYHQGGRRRPQGVPDAQRRGAGQRDRAAQAVQHRHRGGARLGADRPGDQERRRPVAHRPHAEPQRPRQPRAGEEAAARRGAERDVHHHEPGRLRVADGHADHPRSHVGDHGRRRDREAAEGDHGPGRRGHDRRAHLQLLLDVVRPPHRGRRRRRPLHGARQEAARDVPGDRVL